jgi:hypothetical protein
MTQITGPGNEDHPKYRNITWFSTFNSIENETILFCFQRLNKSIR